jgi:predicted Zn-dependent peptidase
MNKVQRNITIAFSFILIGLSSLAQQSQFIIKKFTLDNGLTVILNPDPNAVGVFGAMAVKAGSKNDPADATGMAHYLEHLLFKGTTELGTTDYAKEKPYLDSIVYYYDLLGKTTDEETRKKIQKLINNQSVQSAKYANPTEFDKLIKSIGGKDLNAFTANDMTVYHNAFPGEQIEKWLELYAHRLQNPVFRSFQSELEVVYEEKNRGMDSPFSRVFEEVQSKLFQSHPYGTQSTIGTVEHLKNPSLTKMYKYFNDYYVANNMGLIISGNFDVATAERVIRDKFSKLRSAPVPQFPNYSQSKFEKKDMVEVDYTPIKIEALGFKTFGNRHKDKLALQVCNSILYNGSQTGLLDKLQLEGKLLGVEVSSLMYNDDGANMVVIVPKVIGQSFEEAEALVFAEIEKVKKGQFSDTLMSIIKQEIAVSFKKGLEDENSRCMTLVSLFSQGATWDDYLADLNKINQLTKEDVIKVANKYFIENYLVYRSSTGFPKKEVLDKPGFEPVVADQKIESAYATKFLSDVKENTNPRILDYDKDAVLSKLHTSDLYITPNPYNDIFSLKIERGVGLDTIKNLEYTSQLFNYFYTKDMSIDQIKKEFGLLGISYYAYSFGNRTIFAFEGPENNLKNALPTIKELVYNPKVDQASLKTIIEGIKSDRSAELKFPDGMGNMLLTYAMKGKNSTYLSRTPFKSLDLLKAEDILASIKQTENYASTYHFVGNIEQTELKSLLSSAFSADKSSRKVPYLDELNEPISKNKVLIVDDKKAVQSQIYFLMNTSNFSGEPKDEVYAEAFNSYMSDGFSGILMQEIREYRSLAYSTSGAFISPIQKNKPGFFYAYIGCQVDKSIDAISVLDSILLKLPKKPERLQMIKAGLINSMSASYPNFRSVSSSIAFGREMGYTKSPRLKKYEIYKNLTFDNIVTFYEQNILNRPRVITIYGNAKKINPKILSNYGDIQKLKIKDIRVN